MLVMNRQRFSRASRESGDAGSSIDRSSTSCHAAAASSYRCSRRLNTARPASAWRRTARSLAPRGQFVRAGGAQPHPPHVRRAGRAPAARPLTRSPPRRRARSASACAMTAASETTSCRLCSSTPSIARDIPGPQELEISRRNLEAGHVAEPVNAEERSLERRQAAVGVLAPPHKRRAGGSMSKCGSRSVGASRRWNAHRISINGHVERAAVERDEERRGAKDVRERVQHRALIGRDRSGRTAEREIRRPRTSRSRRRTRACRRRR